MNATANEAEMSEAKEAKAKQPVTRAKAPNSATVANSAAAASPEPTVVAKTAAPVVALPQPLRQRARSAADDMLASYCGTMAAIGESQRAVASGVKALALEMGGMAHANLTAAGDSATAMISARSFADAVEIQLGFARRSLDSLLAGSARLSDIGARLASDASRPIVAAGTRSGHND
jgi:hypothetical protein